MKRHRQTTTGERQSREGYQEEYDRGGYSRQSHDYNAREDYGRRGYGDYGRHRQYEDQAAGWSGLIGSMIGFTNAVTMFSIQQMQNAFGLLTDSRDTLDRFKRAIDSMSQAMASEMEPSRANSVNEVTRAATEAASATADVFTPDEDDSRTGRAASEDKGDKGESGGRHTEAKLEAGVQTSKK
jgi:hypothetical protein